MEAALDSLGAVELRNALSQNFDIELPATLAFDHPSISAITTYIVDLIGAGDDISDVTVGGSREHSRKLSFHSMQSELASVSTSAKLKEAATAIFAMSCRFPSPAGANDAISSLHATRQLSKQMDFRKVDIDAPSIYGT